MAIGKQILGRPKGLHINPERSSNIFDDDILGKKILRKQRKK